LVPVPVAELHSNDVRKVDIGRVRLKVGDVRADHTEEPPPPPVPERFRHWPLRYPHNRYSEFAESSSRMSARVPILVVGIPEG
jgi:hypothetical protein